MPLASAGKVRIAAVAIKTKIAVATGNRGSGDHRGWFGDSRGHSQAAKLG